MKKTFKIKSFQCKFLNVYNIFFNCSWFCCCACCTCWGCCLSAATLPKAEVVIILGTCLIVCTTNGLTPWWLKKKKIYILKFKIKTLQRFERRTKLRIWLLIFWKAYWHRILNWRGLEGVLFELVPLIWLLRLGGMVCYCTCGGDWRQDVRYFCFEQNYVSCTMFLNFIDKKNRTRKLREKCLT